MQWIERLLPGYRRRRALNELGAEFVRNGRDEFLFVDGAKRLPIYAELQGRGSVQFVVYEGDAIGHWLPPHEAEPLTESLRQEVLALFLRYLAIFDYRVEVLSGAGMDTR